MPRVETATEMAVSLNRNAFLNKWYSISSSNSTNKAFGILLGAQKKVYMNL